MCQKKHETDAILDEEKSKKRYYLTCLPLITPVTKSCTIFSTIYCEKQKFFGTLFMNFEINFLELSGH